MKLKKIICITAVALSLQGTIIPQNVFAAETVTKTQTFETNTKRESAYDEKVSFEETFEDEQGIYQLESVEYEITDTEYKDKVTVEKTFSSETDVPDSFIGKDGNTYTLLFTSEKEDEDNIQKVNAYTDYDKEITADSVPAEKTVEAVNSQTGETEKVQCKLAYISEPSSLTRTRIITVTFLQNESKMYYLNGEKIVISESDPDVSGFIDEVFNAYGILNESEVTNVAWAGEAYTGEDGENYRTLNISVEEPVASYRANYEGTIELSENSGIIIATYVADDTEGEAIYKVTATATYTVTQTKLSSDRLMLIVIAGIVIIAGIVLIIVLLAGLKKKSKASGEADDTEEDASVDNGKFENWESEHNSDSLDFIDEDLSLKDLGNTEDGSKPVGKSEGADNADEPSAE